MADVREAHNGDGGNGGAPYQRKPDVEADNARMLPQERLNSDGPEEVIPNVLADGWRPYLQRSLTTLILEEKLNLLMLVRARRAPIPPPPARTPRPRPARARAEPRRRAARARGRAACAQATPFAIVSRRQGWGDGLTFFCALVAICPFAERISFVTEQLAMYTNDTLGGLLNATFGNVTELIVSIFALKAGMLHIVQVNLLGSVLSNLLLVLGCALFFGGLKNESQHFNRNAANMNSSLLLLAAMSIAFPTAISMTGAQLHANSILLLSRVMAILLLIVYAAFLYFQLATHRHLFEAQDDDEGGGDFVLGFWGALFWLGVITIFIAVLSVCALGEGLRVRAEVAGMGARGAPPAGRRALTARPRPAVWARVCARVRVQSRRRRSWWTRSRARRTRGACPTSLLA